MKCPYYVKKNDELKCLIDDYQCKGLIHYNNENNLYKCDHKGEIGTKNEIRILFDIHKQLGLFNLDKILKEKT